MAKERIKQLVIVAVALSVAVFLVLSKGASWWGVAAVGVLGVGFLLFLGRRGRHTSWETARGQVGTGHAVVFWKPGCMYCERLLRTVGKDDRVTWVNVRVDKQANAEVRGLNNGDELTPTVVVGDRVMRNPSATELVESLSA